MNRNYLIFFVLAGALLLVLAQWMFLPVDAPYSSILVRANLVVLIFSILLFFCFYEQEAGLRGQTLRAIYLLVLGFFIVHYQIYFDLEFGSFYAFGRNYILAHDLVNEGVLISLAGLLSMLCGYMVGILCLKSAFSSRAAYIGKKVPVACGWLSLILLLGLLLTTNLAYFQGGYATIERSYVSLQFEIFLMITIFASFASAAYLIRMDGAYVGLKGFFKRNSYVNLFAALVYMSLIVTSGDRGPVISIGLIGAGAYYYSQNIKLKFLPAMFYAIVVAVFVSTLGFVREAQDEGFWERVSSVRQEAELHESDYSVFKPTHELAISIRSWHAAMLYVKDSGYKYGLMQLNQVLAIVPGVGAIFREFTGLSGEELKSADILTDYLGSDHGVGTTVVADIYIDFSVYGVVIFLFLLGLWARLLDLNLSAAVNPSLFLWVCGLILLSRGIYISRSTLLVIFRDIFLVYVLIVFLGYFFRKKA